MDCKRKIEGARAFNEGVERHGCPYATGSISFQDWVDGWAQQKAEADRLAHNENAVMELALAS